MAKVKVKATTEDFEKGAQDMGDFIVAPPGYYILQLSEVSPEFTKDKDGSEIKSKPYLQCVWKIVGVGAEEAEPTENYGNIWDVVSYSAESGWSRGRFLRAIGAASGDEDVEVDLEIDPDVKGTIIGTKVLARVKNRRRRKQPGDTEAPGMQARIASLLPYSERNTIGEGAAAFEGVEEDDTDTAGTSTGGGDDGEDQPYTEEELNAMEGKELGAVAKDEFNLNPNDSIVKVRGKVNAEKSKAKLIEAILEAQSAEDGETEDGDSPF